MQSQSRSNVFHREEWHVLLGRLKRTVEGLLAIPSNNVWSMYGGLDRMTAVTENIMMHRLKVTQVRGEALGLVLQVSKVLQKDGCVCHRTH